MVNSLKTETEQKVRQVIDQERLVIEDDLKIREEDLSNEEQSLLLKKRREARNGFYYFLK